MDDWIFENLNVLQSETGFQICEPSASLYTSIRCPHCLQIGSFKAEGHGLQYSKKAIANKSQVNVTLRVFLRVCPNTKCKGVVLSVLDGSTSTYILPPEVLDFDESDLPQNLLKTLKEAIACHSVGAYRACAMMVRRLLEEICEDSQAQGKDLHHKLEALRSKVVLPQDLFDAMAELKALGNDAAHISAKSYLDIGRDEAGDSLELAKEILKARYQLKGLVERLRARKGSVLP